MSDRTPGCTSPFNWMLCFLAGGLTGDDAASSLAGEGGAKRPG